MKSSKLKNSDFLRQIQGLFLARYFKSFDIAVAMNFYDRFKAFFSLDAN